MRVVLDVNVLISALLRPGICRTIVESLEEDRFIPVLSISLLEDTLRTLEKPRLKSLIPSSFLDEIFFLIHRKALFVEPTVVVKACRDPADDAVLEAAISGKASLIVTGDKDLLTLGSFKNVPIIPPRTFANRLGLK